MLRCFYGHDHLCRYDINSIDPNKVEDHLPDEQLYLGAGVHRLLLTSEIAGNKDLLKDVRSSCRVFLITDCQQMKARFPFDNKLLQLITDFSVRKCLSSNALMATPSLVSLAMEVPRIYNGDLQALDDEWQHLHNMSLPDDLKQTNNTKTFFRGLRKLKNEDDEQVFSVLPQFALDLLALPTSNADVERIFSKVGLVKTKQRNKLQNSTQTALVHVSEAVKARGGCVKFQPTQDMIRSVKQRGLIDDDN